MISTFFLVGLIGGFALGRFLPNNFGSTSLPSQNPNGQTTITNTENTPPYVNQIPQNPATETANNTSGDNGVTPSAPQTAPFDYTALTKGQTKDGLWTLGSPKAKVMIEEFSDFQCPFCHQYFTDTFHKILNDYVAKRKVYYVYYNYPLNFHPQAEPAAEAALCAGDQQKYWEMHDLLFNEQASWSGKDNHTQIFQNFAEKLQLNTDTFNNCIRSEKYAKQIQKDLKAGNSRKVTGTPTFFINGTEQIVGAQDYSDFQNAIEAALAK